VIPTHLYRHFDAEGRLKRIIIAAALLAAAPALANPPGYDPSWTSKEAADAAHAAGHAYNDCLFHHLWNYAKKTAEPAGDVVKAAHGACWYERKTLLAAMRKAQPTWERDWLDKRDRELEPDEMSIVLEARLE
jgi:hypothetical protein